MKAILLAMFVMYVLSGYFAEGRNSLFGDIGLIGLPKTTVTATIPTNTYGSPTQVTANPASGYMIVVGPLGGNSGKPFTDEPYWKKNGEKITAVKVRSGSLIDSIQVRYGDVWAPMHGGPGGSLHKTLNLTSSEKIILVQGSFGASRFDTISPLVMSLAMITDDGTVFGQFGSPSTSSWPSTPSTFISYPNPCSLAYVSGRAKTVKEHTVDPGTYLASLTLHWQC